MQGSYELAVQLRDRSCFNGHIGCNIYGDEDALFLSNRDIPQIHKVFDVYSVTDEGARYLSTFLSHNSSQDRLGIHDGTITDVGAKLFAEALHQNSNLIELLIYDNNIGNAGAAAFAEALCHNSTLRELNLSSNSIADAGAVALAKALCHNSTLKKLGLYGNDGIGRVGTCHFIEALTVNSIVTVTLSNDCERPHNVTIMRQ